MNIIEKAVDKLIEEDLDVPALGENLVGPTVGVRLHRKLAPAEDGLNFVNTSEQPGSAAALADDPTLAEPSRQAIDADLTFGHELDRASLHAATPASSLPEAPNGTAGTQSFTPQQVLSGAASVANYRGSNDGVPTVMDGTTTHEVVVDLVALRKSGFVTPDSVDSLMGEQHRIIKRPLLLKSIRGGPHWVERGNLILVTSSLPNEGKTFISTNLAMSIASEVERTVLLIDADVVKGDVSKVFGLNDRPGLTNYLRGESPLPELLYRTNIPSLTILPAGPRVKNLTELLSSAQMERFAEELSTRYADRVVVLDSAPLLATSGTNVLVNLVGQIVFVIEAVRTPQHAVREALETISSHPSIGAVLNKSRYSERSRYNYYGYYAAQQDG